MRDAGANRTVDLPEVLVRELRVHRLRSPHAQPEHPVLASQTGRPLDHRNLAGRALRRAVQRSAIADPAPTFHDLRHSFASRFIAAGGDLVELSAHLGHRDPAVTAGAYSHEFERHGRSRERRARLDAMFAPSDASTMPATQRSAAQPATGDPAGELVDLHAKRNAAQ